LQISQDFRHQPWHQWDPRSSGTSRSAEC
jgi:hypothetical protein